MKILVLTDFKIGSSKQSIALAKTLSDEIIVKEIKYNNLIKIPNFLRFKLLGYDLNQSIISELIDYNADVIIFSGRRLSNLAIFLKKHSKQDIKLITIVNPQCDFKYFSSIILPYHDKNCADKYNNIIRIHGSICSFDLDKIKSESKMFEEKLNNINKLYISLIIGGDTKNKKYNASKFASMIKSLSEITNKLNGFLLITTSRRTSKECSEAIKNNLFCQNYFYNWKEEQNFKNLNPYNAFLNLSDFVVITGDSISMISEVLTFGKTTYIYKPEESLETKHIKFIKELLKDNLAMEFKENTAKLEKFNTSEFNELKRIKEIILKNLINNNN